jgi:TolB protein
MYQSSKKCGLFFSASIFLGFIFLSGCGPQAGQSSIPTITETQTSSPSSIVEPTQTPYVITATSETSDEIPNPDGLFFLSLPDSGHYHLFAYSPLTQPLTRITQGAWDDITPVLSPDGNKLAFASNRTGYWDLYTLDLFSGTLLKLTDTQAYDAAPSWSPDGLWLAFETYENGHTNIVIHSSTDPAQQSIVITQDAFGGSSPAWSPFPGRMIAFVSNRGGEPDIWLANLDLTGEERFTDVSQNPDGVEAHPAWSSDGRYLAWSAPDADSGLPGVYLWDSQKPSIFPEFVGEGDWPVWQNGSNLGSSLVTPNKTYLVGFSKNGEINLPAVLLPNPLKGLTFGFTSAPLPGIFSNAAMETPAPLFSIAESIPSTSLADRESLVKLQDIDAPYPEMQEGAANSFQALRAQVALETGWDALANLENAFIPITSTLDPGLGGDWLFTGRAFTLNPALIQANWMTVVREDFGQQTYWRIFLRTTAQDGSMGTPLVQTPWDFSARSGDAYSYENGGRMLKTIPPGYWVDLTALASQYGWERLPALMNWRTYYSGARFNELVFSQGLDWRTAMLQLYPPEILVTPTIVIPPTRTPTWQPDWYKSPTPTRTPTPRPSYTP